jgi:hypothetical protein
MKEDCDAREADFEVELRGEKVAEMEYEEWKGDGREEEGVWEAEGEYVREEEEEEEGERGEVAEEEAYERRLLGSGVWIEEEREGNDVNVRGG